VYCRVRLQDLPERAALEQVPVLAVPVLAVPVLVVPALVVPVSAVPVLAVPVSAVPVSAVPVSAVLALAVAPAVPVMWAAQPGLYLRAGLNSRARPQVLKQMHLAQRYPRLWCRRRTPRGAARN
jgi:hypothetical protein